MFMAVISNCNATCCTSGMILTWNYLHGDASLRPPQLSCDSSQFASMTVGFVMWPLTLPIVPLTVCCRETHQLGTQFRWWILWRLDLEWFCFRRSPFLRVAAQSYLLCKGIGLHVLADNNRQALEGHGNGVVRWFHCLNAGHDDHWVKVTSHSHAHPLLRVLFFPARLRLCRARLLMSEAPGFRLGNHAGWAPFSVYVCLLVKAVVIGRSTMIYKCHQNISESEPTSTSSTPMPPVFSLLSCQNSLHPIAPTLLIQCGTQVPRLS